MIARAGAARAALGDGHPGGRRAELVPRPAAAPLPADLGSADDAAAEASEAATALRALGIVGVLGPVVDVGLESGSALGARVYSDDPAEVAAYADATVRAYREGTSSAR